MESADDKDASRTPGATTRARQPSVVVFGGPPYQATANQTPMQMVSAMSIGASVLYVARTDPRPLSTRRWKDLFRLKRRSAGSSGLRRLGPNLALLNLPEWSNWLPLVAPEPMRRLQLFVIQMMLKKALSELGFTRPSLISYWWMFPEIASMPRWSFRTFDVIDRHWGYEYLRGRARRVNWGHAVATARSSDRVVAVSEALASELQGHLETRPEVLPNGVDADRVRQVIDKLGVELHNTKRPRSAAYVGGWNRRVDVDLVSRLVRALPDWQFTIIGVQAIPDLADQENVRIIGDLGYDEVISELARTRVGLVPFYIDSYTKASSFLKVFDYLAAGMSVLATPLPAVEAVRSRFPEHVHVAPGSNWISALRVIGESQAPPPLDLDSLPTTSARAESLIAPIVGEGMMQRGMR